MAGFTNIEIGVHLQTKAEIDTYLTICGKQKKEQKFSALLSNRARDRTRTYTSQNTRS